MMLAALLMACAIFLGVFFAAKATLSPEGFFQKKQTIKARILSGSASLQGTPEAPTIIKKDHLSDIRRLQEILQNHSYASNLALLLKRSGAKFSLTGFLCGFLTLAAIIYMVAQFYMPKMMAFLLFGLALAFPFFYLKKKNAEYLRKFSENLPDATSIISNSLKVGQSIEMAIENVGRSGPFPLSVEFQSVCGEIKLGLSLEKALKNLHDRIQLPELKIFVTGICIQQELGGNLSEIMGNLEKTIRERFAMQREIKVLSAQGIMTIWVLMCLPIAFAGVWFGSQRELLMGFLGSGMGKVLVGIALVLQLIAFFWMRKVVDIKD